MIVICSYGTKSSNKPGCVDFVLIVIIWCFAIPKPEKNRTTAPIAAGYALLFPSADPKAAFLALLDESAAADLAASVAAAARLPAVPACLLLREDLGGVEVGLLILASSTTEAANAIARLEGTPPRGFSGGMWSIRTWRVRREVLARCGQPHEGQPHDEVDSFGPSHVL